MSYNDDAVMSQPVSPVKEASTPNVLRDLGDAANVLSTAAEALYLARENHRNASERFSKVLDNLAKYREQEGL